MNFTHLHVHSNFSLLDGAAPVEDLVESAADMGMESLALTDHNGLYGAVRFYRAATEAGIKPIIGAEITIEPLIGDFVSQSEPNSGEFAQNANSTYEPAHERLKSGCSAGGRSGTSLPPPLRHQPHLVLLAEDNEGYSNLCRLITAARLGVARYAGPFSEDFSEVDRDNPVLSQADLREHSSHLIALSGCPRGEIPQLIMAGDRRWAAKVAQHYRGLFGPESFYIELQNNLLPPPYHVLRHRLGELADHLNIRTVATNNVHYVDRDDAPLQDVLVCINNKQAVDEPHPDRKVNCEYDLKSPAQMAQLFPDQPEAVRNTQRIAERCNWELDLENFHFPTFDLQILQEEDCGHYPPPKDNETEREYLRRLCYAGAKWRYGDITPQVGQRLEHELSVIEDQGLSAYFIITWDIMRFARSRNIRATGRGSAADSLVSHVLDLTQPDPIAHNLLFERFLSPERKGMPDVDIDFCARRRDEVTAYVYERYGAENVAAVCTVNTYRARSAIREVGKALGMDDEELGPIAESFPHGGGEDLRERAESLPEAKNAAVKLADHETFAKLCHQISGFPRHLGVHVGGLVIAPEPLTNLMPLELSAKGIVISAFDKDDIEDLGLVKMDILGLRIHSAIEDCLDTIQQQSGQRPDIENIPLDDEAAYRLLRSTHTVGLFQLESPGQRNLLGRAQPREFEEIIANISLFRPGPVQSDMITPYLRRKHGQERVTYLHSDLELILKSTYGVIIYQEQVLQIASTIGGFTLGQGDMLRRAMTHDRSDAEMEKIRSTFVEGAVNRGVDEGVAERIFDDIAGFAAYGFNKAHAACFGKIAYQTAYLKAHYPAAFLAGILSNEPMGFYPPRAVAEEAKRFGVDILPPCVNESERRFSVQGGDIRVGLEFIRGMSERAAQSIVEAREEGLFTSLRDFCRRTSVPRPVIENLILARAFDFTGRDAAELLWMLASLPKSEVADRRGRRSEMRLDFQETEMVDDLPDLDAETEYGRTGLDLKLFGVSTGPHPFSFWTEKLDELGVTPSTALYSHADGDKVRVAGIVVSRARPPTRSGRTAIFICLEDHKGLIDTVIFEDAYQKYGDIIYESPVLMIEGTLSRQGKLDLSVIADRVVPLGSWRDLGRSGESDRLENVTVPFPSKDGGR